MAELAILVTLGFALWVAYFEVGMYLVVKFMFISILQAWCLVTSIAFTATAILMASVTAFILIKLHCREHSVLSKPEIDFQRLVALVALVFCCNELSVVVLYTIRFNDWSYEMYRDQTHLIVVIVTFLNSSVNLPLYLAASQNFRAAFVEFWKLNAES